MLKFNRLITAILSFGLCFSISLFWGIKSSAQRTGGMVHDYDDSFGVKHRVIPYPYLDVEVWVDKGEGATYYPGEKIKVYFQASRDCYMVIYNIDTRGYVHLLYPYDPGDDPYVEGGRVYRIPDRFDEYDLTVDGPSGVEYIQAVASLEPLLLPNFPGGYEYDGEIYAYRLDGEDPFEFMADINAEIAPYDYASDVCIFNVEYPYPRWYYWPRMVYVERPVDILWGGVYFGYPWGVEVWIDGVFYGITPLTIPALVVGRHYVTFWFRGCWIWRDWIYVRRDYTIRIWPDCYDRYRYVEERIVEKSYRATKAKRRRKAEGVGGLLKPVRWVEKERVVKEVPNKGNKKRVKEELRIKRRRFKKTHSPLPLSLKSESRRVEKEIKNIRRSLSFKRRASEVEIKTKTKKVKKAIKRAKKSRGSYNSLHSKRSAKKAGKIRKDKSSRPRVKLDRVRTTKEMRVRKSPTARKTYPKKARLSKPVRGRR